MRAEISPFAIRALNRATSRWFSPGKADRRDAVLEVGSHVGVEGRMRVGFDQAGNDESSRQVPDVVCIGRVELRCVRGPA